MKNSRVTALCLLSFCSALLNASSVTFTVIEAPKLETHQWQALSRLWHESFFNAYKSLPLGEIDADIQEPTLQGLSDHLHRLFDKCRLLALKRSYPLVLAYKDEQLIGYTLYHVIEEKDQALLHINHFAVDPTCQGQGIGKKLLEATIEAEPETVAVVLTTRIHNTQAQAFYKKQGFYEIAPLDSIIFDTRYSLLLRKDI